MVRNPAASVTIKAELGNRDRENRESVYWNTNMAVFIILLSHGFLLILYLCYIMWLINETKQNTFTVKPKVIGISI